MRQKAQLVIFVTRLSFIFITAGKYLSNEVLVLVQKKHVVLKVLKKNLSTLEKLHQQFIFCGAFRSHWRKQPIKICYDKFARADHLSCTHCRLNPLCQVSSWKTGDDLRQTGSGLTSASTEMTGILLVLIIIKTLTKVVRLQCTVWAYAICTEMHEHACLLLYHTSACIMQQHSAILLFRHKFVPFW